ncbi:hypothetical protein FB451DRAFT_1409468 [Mycena latifolia]|nr:hypothetical protein FB451DRAFT_1409468 [Mycena latifolia]
MTLSQPRLKPALRALPLRSRGAPHLPHRIRRPRLSTRQAHMYNVQSLVTSARRTASHPWVSSSSSASADMYTSAARRPYCRRRAGPPRAQVPLVVQLASPRAWTPVAHWRPSRVSAVGDDVALPRSPLSAIPPALISARHPRDQLLPPAHTAIPIVFAQYSLTCVRNAATGHSRLDARHASAAAARGLRAAWLPTQNYAALRGVHS